MGQQQARRIRSPAGNKWNGYAVPTPDRLPHPLGIRRRVDGALYRISWQDRRGRSPICAAASPISDTIRSGGWMILGLMALIAAQCLTGLYAGDEDRVVIEGRLRARSPMRRSNSPRAGTIAPSTSHGRSSSCCTSRRTSSHLREARSADSGDGDGTQPPLMPT